jgi:hypothetical protein
MKNLNFFSFFHSSLLAGLAGSLPELSPFSEADFVATLFASECTYIDQLAVWQLWSPCNDNFPSKVTITAFKMKTKLPLEVKNYNLYS